MQIALPGVHPRRRPKHVHTAKSFRRDLPRVGLNRDRHTLGVRSLVPNGGKMARPKRFELLTPRFVGSKM